MTRSWKLKSKPMECGSNALKLIDVMGEALLVAADSLYRIRDDDCINPVYEATKALENVDKIVNMVDDTNAT